MSATKFHTHTKQQAKLWFYISWSLNFWTAAWKTKGSAPNDSKHFLRYSIVSNSLLPLRLCPICTGTVSADSKGPERAALASVQRRGFKNSDSFYEKVISKISLSRPLSHIGGVAVWLHSFSSLGGRVNLTSRPLFPPGKNPGYTLGRVLGLDSLQKRKMCFIWLGVVKPVFIDSALCRVM